MKKDTHNEIQIKTDKTHYFVREHKPTPTFINNNNNKQMNL